MHTSPETSIRDGAQIPWCGMEGVQLPVVNCFWTLVEVHSRFFFARTYRHPKGIRRNEEAIAQSLDISFLACPCGEKCLLLAGPIDSAQLNDFTWSENVRHDAFQVGKRTNLFDIYPDLASCGKGKCDQIPGIGLVEPKIGHRFLDKGLAAKPISKFNVPGRNTEI
jgi:hypothetical protein